LSALDSADTPAGFETKSTPQHKKKKIRTNLDAFIALTLAVRCSSNNLKVPPLTCELRHRHE